MECLSDLATVTSEWITELCTENKKQKDKYGSADAWED